MYVSCDFYPFYWKHLLRKPISAITVFRDNPHVMPTKSYYFPKIYLFSYCLFLSYLYLCGRIHQ